MRKINNIIFFLAITIPTFFIFRSIFLSDLLVAGDAPHFYPKELSELVREPSAWTSRGENLGGVDPRLWINPLLLLYGGLGGLGLINASIVKIIFYIPSIIMSVVGPVLFVRKLKFSRTIQFFASLVYLFNTYFLLLVDGGQVGVALAYGIFPFSLLMLLKLFEKPTYKLFFATLVILQLNFIADPRIAIISIFSTILILVLGNFSIGEIFFDKKKVLKYLSFLGISLLGLNFYWIFPLLSIAQSSGSLEVSSLQFASLLHPLFLYQPHWPGNVFGQVVQPAWYFIGVPLLIFGSLIFKKKDKIVSLFLLSFIVFAFLAKGGTPPLGSMYSWFVSEIPFGSAFRDASKFFVPLMLLGGVLMGTTIEKLIKHFPKHKVVILLSGYVYLLILLLPALSHKLNFVLSGKPYSNDYSIIRENIVNENDAYRTAWIPERHPLAFETINNPALDAKSLVSLRPFTNLTTGTHEFNYIHKDSKFLDWYRLLGIKYLIVSEDTRNPNPESKLLEEREALLNRLEDISDLQKLDWDTDAQVYEIDDAKPQIFAVDTLVAVVGPEIELDDPSSVVTAYFEDGKLDPLDLEGIASSAATIVFNGSVKDEDDLTMSFLQDSFIDVNSAVNNEWSLYSESEYISYKYQLLLREIVTTEFSYGMGISFSDHDGEIIEFELEVPEEGDYILGIRSLGYDASTISYTVGDEKDYIGHNCGLMIRKDGAHCYSALYDWHTKGVSLKKGKNRLVIKNEKGTNVINTIALVSNDDWNEAQRMTEVFVTHFGVTELDDLESVVARSEFHPLDFSRRYPVWYDFTPSEKGSWIVFTDSYHPDWQLKRGIQYFDSIPAYSMVNTFYVEPDWKDTSIRFQGQDKVRWGIWYSTVSILALMIIFLWNYPSSKE